MKKPTQREQVIEAMRRNGGYATFGQLNRLVDFSSWNAKSPQANVRRIVQISDAFFKIQPGLWALEECRDAVLKKFRIKGPDNKENEIFTHSYYQGLVVEIGNMKGKLQTYIPPQDKNRLFLGKPLRELATIEKIHNFTYPNILRRAITIDVIWFNKRNLPDSFFEVEHSTDIQNSLTKFYELQDYFARFCIIGPGFRENMFDDIMQKSIFDPLRQRVRFFSYENIVNQHEKMSELAKMGGTLI
jgi:hypothetical protein